MTTGEYTCHATRIYTGIGSRSTPPDILALMERAARFLGAHGYTLRSGHADGADLAFERGAAGFPAEIYLPWARFNSQHPAREEHLFHSEPTEYALRNWEMFHPAPERCSQGAQKLHARNVHQIVGYTFPIRLSDFVLCWTPGGADTGGTALAIRLARSYDIPVFNLAVPQAHAQMRELCLSLQEKAA